jgi:hypothetical protein
MNDSKDLKTILFDKCVRAADEAIASRKSSVLTPEIRAARARYSALLELIETAELSQEYWNYCQNLEDKQRW